MELQLLGRPAVKVVERKRTVSYPDPRSKYTTAQSKFLVQQQRKLAEQKQQARLNRQKALLNSRIDRNANEEKRNDREMLGQEKESGLKKRKLLTKLFRVITLKDLSMSKTFPRDYRARHASAKRKRARTSQCSTLSNYEPMPTIVEESESDLSSLQSTIHHFSGLHLGRNALAEASA